MRKNQSSKGGFTLVEIMIVVAIIALLASIAVPAFMRARTRSLASNSLETCRQVDQAKDQWALENHKKGTETPASADLAPYVKQGSKLQKELTEGAAKDELGTAITLNDVDHPPTLDGGSVTEFNKAIPADKQETFFGAYKAGGTPAP